MIALDLCQAHYQVLLTIYLKAFIIICIEIVSLVLIVKDSQLILKFTESSKNHKNHFNKDLIKTFENTYEFCDRDINKFILLLRKGVYPYEYMDSWERFDEELLPDKEAFYSSLNKEDITGVDYRHAKKSIQKL